MLQFKVIPTIRLTDLLRPLLRIAIVCCLLFVNKGAGAQEKTASIEGMVVDENDRPISGVSVTILGYHSGISTSDSGRFHITVPASKAFALIFSHTGYRDVQKNFLLSPNENEKQTVKLFRSEKLLEDIIVRDDHERQEVGLVRINPKNAVAVPSATGGVEGLIKVLVGSNNELTSQYSVRGGNYDENLIYINDYEIYRPYLIRNGQQEGLSFINPELVRNINFYTGGFPASFGDKTASVLQIDYKKPIENGGSAYISLLEQGIHFEGISRNKKWTWLLGARTKNNRNLLSSQETKGDYIPSASDVQALLSYELSDKLSLEALGILSGNRFDFIPESSSQSSAVYSPLFAVKLGLDVQFEGRERDLYRNNLIGITLKQKVNSRTNLKWMISRYDDKEHENFDILGAYIFGERGLDQSKSDFGQIVNPLGTGVFQNFARNNLAIQVYEMGHKGNYKINDHFIEWGVSGKHEKIRDRINEWEMLDSAGYSIPYNPMAPHLNNVVHSNTDLDINRIQGFLQDNIRLGSDLNDLFLQVGARLNYNDLSKEFLASPRAQLSFRPDWEKDVIFKASAGVYGQPPFYKELRRPDGSTNKNLKSQKSIQYVLGADYNTKFGEKPLRITSEAYYKSLADVVSYTIDNVRIIYSGENDAKAYAAGVETRFYTQLVKDADSWLSINISRTKEDLKDDHYFLYQNAAGEIITPTTEDKEVFDSIRKDVGWIRRPSDRLVTIGLFLQDYLSTNKNFRVHLNIIYGSNMTYSIPGSARYRSALIMEPYFRTDIGFSALLLSEESVRRSHSPFRSFKNIWASLEVFNLMDKSNVISYQLIKDFSNNTYTIPNRLTPRLVNFKLIARF